jgi:hypothetical protein
MNEKKEELRARVDRDFTYHPPTTAQVAVYEEIRDQGKIFAHLLVDLCPISRELSLALTHLEQAVMWANAAVARAGQEGN